MWEISLIKALRVIFLGGGGNGGIKLKLAISESQVVVLDVTFRERDVDMMFYFAVVTF